IERCTYCGSSFNDIINSGKVGCANCYDRFEDKLAPSIEKLHGRTKHVGKHVTYTEEADKAEENSNSNQEKSSPISEIDKLKADLQNAIKEQRFEDAAVIRDKINDLSKED
ncbi:MAG: UvrB/UvrC motif-containing protein, partial [Eubacterium sp.]